jgi:hypothetical protein
MGKQPECLWRHVTACRFRAQGGVSRGDEAPDIDVGYGSEAVLAVASIERQLAPQFRTKSLHRENGKGVPTPEVTAIHIGGPGPITQEAGRVCQSLAYRRSLSVRLPAESAAG